MRGAVLTVARLGFAVAAIVAITYQFASLRQGLPTFNPGNFFSFLTIQTNLLAIAMLALVVVVRPPERTVLFDAVRGAVTLYIAITGLVFALLLAGLQESLDTHIAWVDFTVHKLIPVILVADWLLDLHSTAFRLASRPSGCSTCSPTSSTRWFGVEASAGIRTRSSTCRSTATGACS